MFSDLKSCRILEMTIVLFRRYIGGTLIALVWKFAAYLLPSEKYKSIKISSFNPETKDDLKAIENIIGALKIIEKISPTRYNRIVSCFNMIADAKSNLLGNYYRVGRICSVNIVKIRELSNDMLCYGIALTLIYESFQARILNKHALLSSQRINQRIKILANKEELLFLNKIPASIRSSLQS